LEGDLKSNVIFLVPSKIKCLLPSSEGGGKSEHHRAGYFPTGSPGNGKLAPQKQTAPHFFEDLKESSGKCGVRVKWQCKRLPGIPVTGYARKALSGAMPNRKAGIARPIVLSGRQLQPAVRNSPYWES